VRPVHRPGRRGPQCFRSWCRCGAAVVRGRVVQPRSEPVVRQHEPARPPRPTRPCEAPPPRRSSRASSPQPAERSSNWAHASHTATLRSILRPWLVGTTATTSSPIARSRSFDASPAGRRAPRSHATCSSVLEAAEHLHDEIVWGTFIPATSLRTQRSKERRTTRTTAVPKSGTDPPAPSTRRIWCDRVPHQARQHSAHIAATRSSSCELRPTPTPRDEIEPVSRHAKTAGRRRTRPFPQNAVGVADVLTGVESGLHGAAPGESRPVEAHGTGGARHAWLNEGPLAREAPETRFERHARPIR
jgi:hypothetical protein